MVSFADWQLSCNWYLLRRFGDWYAPGINLSALRAFRNSESSQLYIDADLRFRLRHISRRTRETRMAGKLSREKIAYSMNSARRLLSKEYSNWHHQLEDKRMSTKLTTQSNASAAPSNSHKCSKTNSKRFSNLAFVIVFGLFVLALVPSSAQARVHVHFVYRCAVAKKLPVRTKIIRIAPRVVKPLPVVVVKPAPKLVVAPKRAPKVIIASAPKKIWIKGHWKNRPNSKKIWVKGHWKVVR
jgi:hypothetical protein